MISCARNEHANLYTTEDWLMWLCVYMVPHDYTNGTLGSQPDYPGDSNRKNLT